MILVVDDEAMNLIVLGKILTKSGYEVMTASNGEEAIETVKSANPLPDLILMDLMMPQMSGWDATKILKETKETQHIPVVAVTALSNERESTLEFGFDDFCPKPIDFDALDSIIKRYLKKSA